MITLLLTFALIGNVECPDGRCMPARPAVPHPAVVRVINQHGGSRSLGSGTLVEEDGQQPLVATCAHLFRDGVGNIVVEFPRHGRHAAKVAALDEASDLALLQLPQVAASPVKIAAQPPRAGDELTSCGYGPDGVFAVNRGRAAGYASHDGRTFDVLELEGSARRGDSGGPIFNARGELAGVLFGTDGRRVNGSHCGKLQALLQRCRASAKPQTACGCDPTLAQRVQQLEAALAKLKPVAGVPARAPEGAARPSDGTALPAPAAGAPFTKWDLAQQLVRWLPWVAGLGLPGSLAAGVGWWLARRATYRHRSQTTSALPPTFVELPPREREFVEVQIPTQRLAALEQAMDEYVRRNPGARPTVETIEAYAKQYESAGK
jgi:hypothetical protein